MSISLYRPRPTTTTRRDSVVKLNISHSPYFPAQGSNAIHIHLGIRRRLAIINSRDRTTSVNYLSEAVNSGRMRNANSGRTYLPTIFDLVTHAGFININYYLRRIPNSRRDGRRRRPLITYSARNRAVLYNMFLCGRCTRREVDACSALCHSNNIIYYNKLGGV